MYLRILNRVLQFSPECYTRYRLIHMVLVRPKGCSTSGTNSTVLQLWPNLSVLQLVLRINSLCVEPVFATQDSNWRPFDMPSCGTRILTKAKLAGMRTPRLAKSSAKIHFYGVCVEILPQTYVEVHCVEENCISFSSVFQP